jgi:hypothetical protein
MTQTNKNPYVSGDHLVICDICGRQVYRSQAQYRWDGILCCTKYNCWDPKHAIFEQPPVINDPVTLLDVRPDLTAEQSTYVSDIDQVGLTSTFGGVCTNPKATGGRILIGSFHVKIGSIDAPPDYINGG